MRFLGLIMVCLAAFSTADPFHENGALNVTHFDETNYKRALTKRDGCHEEKDNIGDYCWFFNDDKFKQAMGQYCADQFAIPVISGTGKSYPKYLPNIEDGKGHGQTFWGNIRVDRGKTENIFINEVLLHMSMCYEGLLKVYKDCKGYGGWVNTDFGTVFAECIRA